MMIALMMIARRPLAVVVFAGSLAISPLLSAPVEAAKPARGIVSDIFEVGHSDRFVIKGRFKQTYKRRPIIVQQRLNNGRWAAYAKVRSSPTSRFRIRVEPRGATGDVVCYRLIVPGDQSYRRAVVRKATRGQHAGKRFCIETTFG